MDANQYYTDLEKAKELAEKAITEVENNISNDGEFSATNYSKVLNEMNLYVRNIDKMIAIHRFMKLSKDTFIKKAEEGDSKNIEVMHTVKDYETPHSIAKRYGIKLEQILKKNNILTSDFTPGLEIRVEVNPSTELNKVYDDVQTYGDQEGIAVLGKDAYNDLKIGNSGDAEILDPKETLKQGISNRMETKAGEYPLEEDFGLDVFVGSEFPKDVIEALGIAKIRGQLAQDQRISSINEIIAEREQNSIKFTGNVTAINNINLEI